MELGSPEVVQEWVDVTMKTAISLDPKAYIPEFWKQKTRPDGRIFAQARKTTVVAGVLERNALGSALVKFSSSSEMDSAGSAAETADTSNSYLPKPTKNTATHVLAGVTAEVGQPAAGEGDLKITLMPQNAVLESWLQRLLLQVVDLEQLGIMKGKSAFGLDITIAVLNDDGNIGDVCLLAAMAALRDTQLPPIVVQDGRVYTLQNDNALKQVPSSLATFTAKKISLPIVPLSLTMGVTSLKTKGEITNRSEQKWLVDPSKEEESVCDGSITIVVNALNVDQILSLEYQGNVSLTQSSIAIGVQMAKSRAIELWPLLNEK